MKSGQVDKAGSLCSAAARICLDLGLHALPPGVADMTQSRGRKGLWYVFLMEKGLALTLGRPQSLHFYDISTDTSSHPNDVLGIPAKIAAAFFELALTEDEMILQLFSASARHLHPAIRWEKGQGFHERLKKIRLELILVSPRFDIAHRGQAYKGHAERHIDGFFLQRSLDSRQRLGRLGQDVGLLDVGRKRPGFEELPRLP
jgi:hypothetical protein